MTIDTSVLRITVYTAATWLFLMAAVCVSAEAPLATAAELNDSDAIRVLLEKKADVNAAQPDGMTALHWAAHHDDLNLVKRLIAVGASPKVASRYGVTPLTLACTNGNASIVESLLDAGADP